MVPVIVVKLQLMAILAIGIILLAGCAIPQQPAPPSGNGTIMPGSDRDAHGCIPSAGYAWCEEKQKCLRPWEENCTAAVEETSWTEKDEHGCDNGAGYFWCDDLKKCLIPMEENCSEAGNVCDDECLLLKLRTVNRSEHIPTICGKISDQTMRDLCRWFAAGVLQDPKYCVDYNNPRYQPFCEWELNGQLTCSPSSCQYCYSEQTCLEFPTCDYHAQYGKCAQNSTLRNKMKR